MRIALTANGPGEVAGWVRPLLRRLYAHDPDLEAHLFLVPDDYATGGEARMARALFPQARVYEPKEYLAFALGRTVPDAPSAVDVVQYLGGDLMHAARLHKRLGGIAATYKFTNKRFSATLARAFAVDAKNGAELRTAGAPPERVIVVGNLAIDGALLEADLPPEEGAPDDGVLIMPGSRKHEIEQMVPFFLTAAFRMMRERPNLHVAIGISPFTQLDQVARAVDRGGDPRVFAERGRLVRDGESNYLESVDGTCRVPIVYNALAAARRARVVLTIPGTKVIELAALGVPCVCVTPANTPEKVAINGVLSYVDRIPAIGIPLKRAAVLAVSRRFRYFAQPNIDANEEIVRELRGTLTPGRVARVTLERYDDREWLRATGARLELLYAAHAGAADRMAAALLEAA